jgi:hypothetical protein
MLVRLVRCLAVVALMALMPSLAHAQSSITGTIRDASGAVLPGVTVEAASPVLIEKVRSTVSDDTGVYRLTELLPGTYSLTFTLPGFATVTRPGVEITGSGVITINTTCVLVSCRKRSRSPAKLQSSTCRAHGGSR